MSSSYVGLSDALAFVLIAIKVLEKAKMPIFKVNIVL
jgi:hypothetical protein